MNDNRNQFSAPNEGSGAVWILGATGRVGRAVAARLGGRGCPVVLAGRDRRRLDGVAAELPDQVRVVSGSLAETLRVLGHEEPAVVVNTVGPFPETAPQVLAALPSKTHYVDVANEKAAVANLLLRPRSADASRTVVTGVGFGVLGTESVVRTLCAGRPPARSVRVDMIPSVETEAGRVGIALARSLVDGLADGGAVIAGGQPVPAALGVDPEELVTPDGDRVRTAGMPSGELIAAWRASRAASVVAASSMVPSGRIRPLLPVATGLLRSGPLRKLAASRMARMTMGERPKPRAHTWAHARVIWDDEVAEGWLRAPEGMQFTSNVIAQAVIRLLDGGTPPGVYTPGEVFGPELAVAAGGEFVLPTVQRS